MNTRRIAKGLAGLGVIASVSTAAAAPGAAPADELSAVERNTIEIYRRVSPAVVSVANRAIFQDFFSMRLYEIPRGMGSGFVWDRKGHIISNFHVIFQASSIQVTLHGGTNYEAEVVGVDADHDIAVLRIRAPESALSPIEPGSSRDLQVGQTVLAIGNPFGLDASLSVGIVSALGRTITSLSDRQIQDVIQTDAAINPGNSGGPLLDSRGRLVGMNTAIVSPSGGYAGVGFAVPADIIKRVVPQIIEHGKVRRAGLGVQIVPDHIARDAGIEGAAVWRVVPRGAADRAGLKGLAQTDGGSIEWGDVVVEVDGAPVRSVDELYSVMDRHQPGEKVRVVCVRGKERRTLEVTLQAIE
jgi:S1-C subfamily serine protease